MHNCLIGAMHIFAFAGREGPGETAQMLLANVISIKILCVGPVILHTLLKEYELITAILYP